VFLEILSHEICEVSSVRGEYHIKIKYTPKMSLLKFSGCFGFIHDHTLCKYWFRWNGSFDRLAEVTA